MRWAMVLFAAGISAPPVLQLAFIDNAIGREIGIGWLVMVAVQLRYSQDLRRELVRQIDSSVRNAMLVERLTVVSNELTLANSEKEARNAELSVVMEKLNHLVTFDQLTGAYSRRHITEELDRRVALRARHGTPASLIMMDLDHFKDINDRFGHSVGDRALREAAQVAQAQLRDGDMLGRVGGEEFMVLLPMAARDDAARLAERLRVALAAVVMVEGDERFGIPASFGVAELCSDQDASAWVLRADAALYQAKTSGRNRVVAVE
jgi:diguanylate cyclase (GGDEF)-like protein